MRREQGIAVRQPKHVGNMVIHNRALGAVARAPGERQGLAFKLFDQSQAVRLDNSHARS